MGMGQGVFAQARACGPIPGPAARQPATAVPDSLPAVTADDPDLHRGAEILSGQLGQRLEVVAVLQSDRGRRSPWPSRSAAGAGRGPGRLACSRIEAMTGRRRDLTISTSPGQPLLPAGVERPGPGAFFPQRPPRRPLPAAAEARRCGTRRPPPAGVRPPGAAPGPQVCVPGWPRPGPGSDWPAAPGPSPGSAAGSPSRAVPPRYAATGSGPAGGPPGCRAAASSRSS